MRRAALLLGLLGCGARSEIAGERQDAGPSPPSVVTCHPGDPDVVLATVANATQWDRVVTDGAFVYVTQLSDVWVVPAEGGARKSLWTSTVLPLDPVAGDDGVYVNLDPGGIWLRHDGAATKVVHAGAFAPPLVYASSVSGTTTTISSISLHDGSAHALAQIEHPAGAMFVSDEYVHLFIGCGECIEDQRIHRVTGALRPPVEVTEIFGPQIYAGPNAICSNQSCLLDETDASTFIGGTPLALDADHVYVRRLDGLFRSGLRSDAVDLVTTQKARAVAARNGCVYVETPTQLVRIAEPP